MSDNFMAVLFVLGFFAFLMQIDDYFFPVPEYWVTSVHEEHGTECRTNGHTIWIHVNDEAKFKKFLDEQRAMLIEDIKNGRHFQG